MNQATLEFISQTENIALARVAVAAFGSNLPFTWTDLEEIKVAVSEAVTNAIVHGYLGQNSGLIQLNMIADGDTMELTIIDQGQGIGDIVQAMEPNYSSDPHRLGLGFTFMRSFMDKLDVTSRPGQGTAIKMTRKAGVLRPASSTKQ